MKRRVWLVFLALGAAVAASPAQTEEKPAEPFYRKYLVPGNRLDDQILEQQERVDISPDDASLRNDFGNLLAARRFGDQAAEQYELAAKLDKSNFIALYNLGLLYETEGKVSSAINAYQKSIARKPGFPQSHFRLGRLYEKAERNDEAVDEYALAMRIDRSMRDPRRNPLVVDSELIYRASLVNYPRDVATASMARESVFAEEARFRTVPVDRPVSSQEAAEETEGEGPRQISVSDSAGSGAATAPAAAGPRRPGTRPASQDPGIPPGLARPRAPQTQRRPTPAGGTPLVAVPPGSSVPPVPPPVEITPPPSEPEIPPESMPEPTPEAPPVEEEPS